MSDDVIVRLFVLAVAAGCAAFSRILTPRVINELGVESRLEAVFLHAATAFFGFLLLCGLAYAVMFVSWMTEPILKAIG